MEITVLKHYALRVIVECCELVYIDDYAEDGGPEDVLHKCSFYHDTLRPYVLCLISCEARS